VGKPQGGGLEALALVAHRALSVLGPVAARAGQRREIQARDEHAPHVIEHEPRRPARKELVSRPRRLVARQPQRPFVDDVERDLGARALPFGVAHGDLDGDLVAGPRALRGKGDAHVERRDPRTDCDFGGAEAQVGRVEVHALRGLAGARAHERDVHERVGDHGGGEVELEDVSSGAHAASLGVHDAFARDDHERLGVGPRRLEGDLRALADGVRARRRRDRDGGAWRVAVWVLSGRCDVRALRGDGLAAVGVDELRFEPIDSGLGGDEPAVHGLALALDLAPGYFALVSRSARAIAALVAAMNPLVVRLPALADDPRLHGLRGDGGAAVVDHDRLEVERRALSEPRRDALDAHFVGRWIDREHPSRGGALPRGVAHFGLELEELSRGRAHRCARGDGAGPVLRELDVTRGGEGRARLEVHRRKRKRVGPGHRVLGACVTVQRPVRAGAGGGGAEEVARVHAHVERFVVVRLLGHVAQVHAHGGRTKLGDLHGRLTHRAVVRARVAHVDAPPAGHRAGRDVEGDVGGAPRVGAHGAFDHRALFAGAAELDAHALPREGADLLGVAGLSRAGRAHDGLPSDDLDVQLVAGAIRAAVCKYSGDRRSVCAARRALREPERRGRDRRARVEGDHRAVSCGARREGEGDVDDVDALRSGDPREALLVRSNGAGGAHLLALGPREGDLGVGDGAAVGDRGHPREDAVREDPRGQAEVGVLHDRDAARGAVAVAARMKGDRGDVARAPFARRDEAQRAGAVAVGPGVGREGGEGDVGARAQGLAVAAQDEGEVAAGFEREVPGDGLTDVDGGEGEHRCACALVRLEPLANLNTGASATRADGERLRAREGGAFDVDEAFDADLVHLIGLPLAGDGEGLACDGDALGGERRIDADHGDEVGLECGGREEPEGVFDVDDAGDGSLVGAGVGGLDAFAAGEAFDAGAGAELDDELGGAGRSVFAFAVVGG
jgi:hypothetical protein